MGETGCLVVLQKLYNTIDHWQWQSLLAEINRHKLPVLPMRLVRLCSYSTFELRLQHSQDWQDDWRSGERLLGNGDWQWKYSLWTRVGSQRSTLHYVSRFLEFSRSWTCSTAQGMKILIPCAVLPYFQSRLVFDGDDSRLQNTRTHRRKCLWIRFHVPSLRHCRKSFGSIRHAQFAHKIYKMDSWLRS